MIYVPFEWIPFCLRTRSNYLLRLTPSWNKTLYTAISYSVQMRLKIGRVEKTAPRSEDYPLTPTPRTTLRTTPRTTLRTTPTDYPKKSTKFLLRSTKIQKVCLLFLHDLISFPDLLLTKPKARSGQIRFALRDHLSGMWQGRQVRMPNINSEQ